MLIYCAGVWPIVDVGGDAWAKTRLRSYPFEQPHSYWIEDFEAQGAIVFTASKSGAGGTFRDE